MESRALSAKRYGMVLRTCETKSSGAIPRDVVGFLMGAEIAAFAG
jgi:hypothetical protein